MALFANFEAFVRLACCAAILGCIPADMKERAMAVIGTAARVTKVKFHDVINARVRAVTAVVTS